MLSKKLMAKIWVVSRLLSSGVREVDATIPRTLTDPHLKKILMPSATAAAGLAILPETAEAAEDRALDLMIVTAGQDPDLVTAIVANQDRDLTIVSAAVALPDPSLLPVTNAESMTSAATRMIEDVTIIAISPVVPCAETSSVKDPAALAIRDPLDEVASKTMT